MGNTEPIPPIEHEPKLDENARRVIQLEKEKLDIHRKKMEKSFASKQNGKTSTTKQQTQKNGFTNSHHQ
eukprot:CAMPEP_0201569018 /NCGR_PEP_ID=MMETSP0190_2-20130828/10463_1 /ASSEMBLY_ACC=CAM_ASM_000263 /TAXON_ID=37353 /ORGANISM="Rosalina sp." /LENGTH=68 /DNA_ID=CAMNT_0047990871 /DNA_START=43 /DNA_END=249 /DNA_ORIENTATION=+